MNVSVIGSGGWGTALALHLNKQGNHVCLWSYLPEESERLKADRENKEFLPGVPIRKEINIVTSYPSAAPTLYLPPTLTRRRLLAG